MSTEAKSLLVQTKILKEFQIRAETRQDHVDHLADLLRQGIVLDPIEVRKVRGGFEVIKGVHRKRAYEQVGQESVQCLVKEIGTTYEAVKQAFEENDKHRGLPMNRADRRHVLEVALKADPQKPDLEIAKDFGF